MDASSRAEVNFLQVGRTSTVSNPGQLLHFSTLQSARLLTIMVLAWCSLLARAQEGSSAQQLLKEERWPELVQLLSTVPDRSAEQEYDYGIALAHLERWDQARTALLRGARMQPRDKRFPIELAGVAFKQKNNRRAISYLRRALRFDPKDDYANEFLATVYFLQGNFEAAMKYWNRLSSPKPEIVEMRGDPALRVRPALLDHAFAFSPASVMKLEQLRATDARLQRLAVFSTYRLDLAARSDGRFDFIFRAQELDGFGSSEVEALLRTFRGLPFQEITPEYYNLNGSAINITSLARWDADKRRYSVAVSGPPGENPEWRYRFSSDLRNENWELRNGFAGPAPVLASLNLRREQAAAEISRIAGWRWAWLLGVEVSHRDYRNVVGSASLTPEVLASGFQLKQIARLSYKLVRSPEHRFQLSSTAISQAGRLWSQPGQAFEKVQASLEAHWLPQSRGDDLETSWRVRGGKTFGKLPFDELFMLGLERDNDRDLWMRAHVGTRNGRKGSSPLGRDYILSSWDTDKNVYSNGFFAVKLGPFVDTGKVTDAVFPPGSQKWLWDTGAQARLRVLGVGVTLIYGKDLRTGNNAFYATVGR